MRGEFNAFFIVKLIKKLAYALFCCKPLKNRLEHKRIEVGLRNVFSPSLLVLLAASCVRYDRTIEQSTGNASLFVNYEKVKINLDPSLTCNHVI